MNARVRRSWHDLAVRYVHRSYSVAAVVLAAAALTGCGSSEEASPTVTWANGLCSAVTTYSTALRDAGTSVQSSGVSQSSIEDAVNAVTDATQTFASDIKDLGAPDTSAGEAAKQTIDNLASDLEDDANAIKEATSGSSALSAISAVSSTLVTAQDQVKSAIDDLDSLGAKSELQQALADAEACDSVPGLS